jgi:Tfp pilus assembly protein PilN
VQQVDLFLPEFIPSRPRLNLHSLALCALAALVLLALVGSYLYQRLRLARAETAELHAESLRIGESIRELHGDREAQLAAAGQKAGLQQQLQRQRELLADLEQRERRPDAGFSPVLIALSDAARREVWLTGIRLEDRMLTLEGETHAPQTLPDWLARLQQQDAIQARRFSQLTLAPIADKPGLLRFTLAEPAATPADEAAPAAPPLIPEARRRETP